MSRPRFRLSTVILLLLALVSGSVAAADPPSLRQARAEHTATLLSDGRVLIIGGVDDGRALGSVEVVDLGAETVVPAGELRQARSGHTATPLPDGRLLIAGGEADGASLADAELFDPATGTSEPVEAMRWARTDHAAVLLDDGRVLLVGGTAKGKPVARAEIFDVASGSFAAAAKSKAVHRGATAVALPTGAVLVAGRATKKKAPMAELYDPVQDKWSAIRKAPAITGHAATALPDGRVLLVGGSAPRAQLFDPSKGRFAKGPAVAAERADHTVTSMALGEVLIVGGRRSGEETGAIERFDVESDTVETVGELLLPRSGHTTTALPGGGALVAGGAWAGLALDDLLYLDHDGYEVEPLGGVTEFLEPAADARTKADVLAELGRPDAFLTLYPNYTDDPAVEPVSIETWTWFSTGTELTFEGDTLVAEGSVEPANDVLAAPYEPAQFEAWMDLDEVVAAAGVMDHYGGPIDEAGTTELWFAPQLAWSLKDGRLAYIEGVALEEDASAKEDDR